jgi:hypothetical protein
MISNKQARSSKLVRQVDHSQVEKRPAAAIIRALVAVQQARYWVSNIKKSLPHSNNVLSALVLSIWSLIHE